MRLNRSYKKPRRWARGGRQVVRRTRLKPSRRGRLLPLTAGILTLVSTFALLSGTSSTPSALRATTNGNNDPQRAEDLTSVLLGDIPRTDVEISATVSLPAEHPPSDAPLSDPKPDPDSHSHKEGVMNEGASGELEQGNPLNRAVNSERETENDQADLQENGISDPFGLANDLLSQPIERTPTPEFSEEPLGRPARIINYGPRGTSRNPRLYLTFDDGPHRIWTPRILNLLEKHGARATFFVIGLESVKYPDLIQTIADHGHTLGNHLWSHTLFPLQNKEAFRDEVRRTTATLGEHATNCLRPPFGYTSEELRRWSGEEGYEILLWGEPDARDWTRPGSEELVSRLLNGIVPGTILLLHDNSGGETLSALDTVLTSLSASGWKFDQPICPLVF